MAGALTTSRSSLPACTDDEVGKVVAEAGWLAAVVAAGRLGPARSLSGGGAEKLVELRVHVEAGVRRVMRPDEEDARSLRGLEGDHDPQGSSQVLHAEPAQQDGPGQPVSECRAAVERQVIEKRGEGPGVRPVQCCYLLLCAPRRDDFYWHT